jgi:hypothetical protein
MTDEPTTAAEPPEQEEPLLIVERSVGTTPEGQAANALLLSLSRAARSFLLYDPSNEAIRTFLGDLRDKARAFVEAHGRLDLEVRPFELVLRGETVYIERDRERSLAFRMFRDGVRRLIMDQGVTWEELLRLLEVLSIRYSGVRQQEDDIVTLLWKAGFQHIEIEAVEGVLPDEDEDSGEAGVPLGAGGGGGGRASPRLAPHVEAPPDRDLPLPKLTLPRALAWDALREPDLVHLRSELASTQLPRACLDLVGKLLALVASPTDPMEIGDVYNMLVEVRDFLLAEEQVAQCLSLLDLIEPLRETDPELVDRLLAGFVDPRALSRILASVQAVHTAPPPELVLLLERVGGNHLGSMLHLLGSDRHQNHRRITRQLIEILSEGRHDEVAAAMLATEDPAVAADLVRVLARVEPEALYEHLEPLAERQHADITGELLHFLTQQEQDPKLEGALLSIMSHAPSSSLRVQAITDLGERGRPSLLDRLADWVDQHPTELTVEEAEALGRAMARLHPRRARLRFRTWIRPEGLFARMLGSSSQAEMPQWVAASGLEFIDGEEDDKVLEWLRDRAGARLSRRCQASLVRRRRRRRGGEGHG